MTALAPTKEYNKAMTKGMKPKVCLSAYPKSKIEDGWFYMGHTYTWLMPDNTIQKETIWHVRWK